MDLAVAPQASQHVRNPEEVIEMLKMRELFILAGLKRVRDQIIVAKDRKKTVRCRRAPPVSAPPRLRVPMKRRVRKGERCTVCQSDLDSDVVYTECSHAFHMECLDQWAAVNFENPTCPVCRRRLLTPLV